VTRHASRTNSARTGIFADCVDMFLGPNTD
jgi:hypothetical protein